MRKPKTQQALQRKAPCREPYDRVLIVCEGKKTETTYLADLKKDHGLSSANVIVAKNTEGSAPKNVVAQALRLYRESDADYDRVFCVIDRDEHPTFDGAIETVRQAADSGVPIEAIVSNPCIEVWFSLHFSPYSTAAIIRRGNKSPGDCAVKKLKEHMPSYEKSITGLYDLLKPHMEQAINYAERLLKHHDNVQGDRNPSTQFHQLVTYLIHLRDTPCS